MQRGERGEGAVPIIGVEAVGEAVAVAVSVAVVVVVVVVVWGNLQGDAGNSRRCHSGHLWQRGLGSCPLANHRWVS